MSAEAGSARSVVMAIPPETQPFLLPLSQAVGYGSSEEIEKINRYVETANRSLKQLCEETETAFLDAHQVLSEDGGRLDRRFAAADGYHINYLGYGVLAKELIGSLATVSAQAEMPSSEGATWISR